MVISYLVIPADPSDLIHFLLTDIRKGKLMGKLETNDTGREE